MDYDKTKYYLGKLCKYRHEYKHTTKSLRYISTYKCKICEKIDSAKKYQKNKVAIKKRVNQYHKKNRSQILIKQKQYRNDNKEKIKFHKNKWYLLNRTSTKFKKNRSENQKKYRESHREKIKITKYKKAKKERLLLYDWYIKERLKRLNLPLHPQLIRIKRLEIENLRIEKFFKKEQKNAISWSTRHSSQRI